MLAWLELFQRDLLQIRASGVAYGSLINVGCVVLGCEYRGMQFRV